MDRPPFAQRQPDLAGCRVLVVGLGRSGLAATRLAIARGARVVVCDLKVESELRGAAAEAERLGAQVHGGGQPPRLADDADLVIVSPGVPPGIDLLEAARHRGLPVWGEVELGARFCHGRVLAITGSNGKSTTTSMLGAALRGASIPGGTGGNLATPFCELLALDSTEAIHALELSSFQLETVESLHPEVAVLVNLSPDHLDRHGSFEAYARAKERLFTLQTPADAAVLNADDEPSARFIPRLRGRLHTFSTRSPVLRGACVVDGRIVLRLDQGDETVMDVAALPVPGEHNLANALAAALAARLAGLSIAAIATGLQGYRPLPHRLEPIAEIDGVAYFNDSKATNPASTLRALEAFRSGSVHLILGGKDKGADWQAVIELAAERARRVLLVGEAAALLAGHFAGRLPCIDCGTVAVAVSTARHGAAAGDVVLLAPGCASYDQYRNFEERGEDFRRTVLAMMPNGGGDA